MDSTLRYREAGLLQEPDDGFEQRHRVSHDALDRIYEPVLGRLERTVEILAGVGLEEPVYLSELLRHAMTPTGKRLRPALTLLASNFHPNDGAKVEMLASAVELLHVASLVHDDTVDNSEVRRGRATVSSLWGKNAAVLAGDYLFAKSATFMCDTGNIRVIRRFAETAMELSSGELHELASAYNPDQTRDEYLRRIRNKTASLFATAGESGGILSGASEPTVQALREYSYNVGMAFQIVDDILDFDGRSEEVGKPVGNDLAQGILTLPAIMVIERYPEDNPVTSLCRQPDDEDSLRRSLELIQDSSILADSFAVAGGFTAKALDALGSLEPNPSRESLEALVSYVVQRRR